MYYRKTTGRNGVAFSGVKAALVRGDGRYRKNGLRIDANEAGRRRRTICG